MASKPVPIEQPRKKRQIPPPGRKLTVAEARELSRKQFSKTYKMLSK